MKIAVCVKRVPDMDVRFRIGADNVSVDETGLKFDINDFDAWAVEAALQLRDKNAGSEVTVISLGPDVSQGTEHGRRSRHPAQGRQSSVRWTRDCQSTRRGAEGGLVRSHLLRENVTRFLERRRRADGIGATRNALRYRYLVVGDRRRKGEGQARIGRRAGDRRVPTASGSHCR
ncbi:MAG: hypothetical protein DMD63_12490 [Gemmatimonadetes bacterium]|nr:MAG: hypothetical protein DMD63_12490 [Gemmatimonadota bacterium]